MLVGCPKVCTQFSLTINVRVLLILEKDDTLCRYKSSKIVLSWDTQSAEIHPVYFCADFGAVVGDVCCILEEIFETRVPKETLI